MRHRYVVRIYWANKTTTGTFEALTNQATGSVGSIWLTPKSTASI